MTSDIWCSTLGTVKGHELQKTWTADTLKKVHSWARLRSWAVKILWQFENSGPEFELSPGQCKLLGILRYIFLFLSTSTIYLSWSVCKKSKEKKKKKEAEGLGIIWEINKHCFHVCTVLYSRRHHPSKKKEVLKRWNEVQDSQTPTALKHSDPFHKPVTRALLSRSKSIRWIGHYINNSRKLQQIEVLEKLLDSVSFKDYREIFLWAVS